MGFWIGTVIVKEMGCGTPNLQRNEKYELFFGKFENKKENIMNKRSFMPTLMILALLSLVACTDSEYDLISNPFAANQAELLEVVNKIAKDAMTANLDGLKGIHLVSDKFTKFGPRSFDRQNVQSTNESEAAFFSSIRDLKLEVKDLKIDVFGEIGIATYYPHYTFEKDGEKKSGSSRQTLVFLKTKSGWKIVHEHGTIKK